MIRAYGSIQRSSEWDMDIDCIIGWTHLNSRAAPGTFKRDSVVEREVIRSVSFTRSRPFPDDIPDPSRCAFRNKRQVDHLCRTT